MPGPVNLVRADAVDGWLARVGRGLWPPRCLVCGERAQGPLDLCDACAVELPWMPPACLSCAMPLAEAAPAATGAAASRPRLCSACQHDPPPLSETHAVFVYGFPLDRLLPRLKFHRDLAAGRLLSQAMAAALATCPRPAALVPVPLHRARLGRRGYNQALELARPVGRLLGLPVSPGLVRRVRHTAPQSQLDAGMRVANLRDAFEVPLRAAVPMHLALVDDVMTTGATLNAAAEALLEAGAERVDAWVCARAP